VNREVSRIYLDNAATSFPKPAGVQEAMARYATELGASPGRGAYAEAREAGRLVQECRARICELVGGEDPAHVIFTLNTTDALNLAIRGIVSAATRPHVITTQMDHNSVLRPFNALAAAGAIEQTRLEVDPATGLLDPDDLRRAIRPETCLVAIVHGSNVTGTLQPIAELGRITREHDVPLLVDAAQTLGHRPVDVEAMHIDLLAFPGHKGLLGPLGTGGLYIRPGIESRMRTVREGGTGSRSERDVQPDFLPDRFESGSHNAIGIIGLGEGVRWILERGVAALWEHERGLMQAMIEGLGSIDGLRYLGPPGLRERCGVFSIRIEGYDDPAGLSDLLERDYGLLTRSGIHCAPLAHHAMSTRQIGGATRLSLGPFLTVEEIRYATDALADVAEAARVST